MKRSNLIISVSVFLGSLILTSCSSPSEKAEQAQKKVAKASDALNAANEEYLADIENCRKETRDKISTNDKIITELKERVADVKGDAKGDYNRSISELEQKNQEMKRKMEEYKADGKEKWELFKIDFNKGMDDIGKSLKDLVASNKQKK